MKKLFLLILCFFVSKKLHSQSFENEKNTEKLAKIIRYSKDDSAKIYSYHELCNSYYPHNPSKIEYFNNKIQQLSIKTKSVKGIGFYNLNLSKISFLKGDLKNAILYGEKSYKLLSKTSDLKNRLEAATFLAFTYYENYEDKRAREILKKNLSIAHKLNDNKILGRMYIFLASTYQETNPVEEFKYNKKALIYYDLIEDKIGKVALYHRMSIIHKKIMAYDECLKYLEMAIKLSSDDTKHILSVEKANIYNKMEHYSKAKSIAEKNYNHFIKTKQNLNSIFYTNNLCLAVSNFELKNYNEAIKICLSILKFKIDNETKKTALNILSKCYLKLNNLEKSIIYINKSHNIKEPVSGDYEVEEEYKIKSDIEEALRNFKKALFYKNIYLSLIIKKNKNINQNKLQLLQVDFDLSDKENKIKKLEIDSLQKTILMEKQKNHLLFTYLIIFFSVIIIFSTLNVLKTIKKENKIIEETNIQLEKSVQLTNKSIREKELLLKEIHHRVKNNLQLIMSLLNIQVREGETKDINEFLKIGESRIISIALIHENLYQNDKLNKVNFQIYIENLILNINNAFGSKYNNIITEIESENINFDIQTAIPLSLIINELYCNILKHAFPNCTTGNVKIELIKIEKNEFQLTVSDNGIGFEKHTRKTLGLELVHLLVEQINGKIILEKNNGTIYIINFKEFID